MTSRIHSVDNIEIISLKTPHIYSITNDIFFSTVFSLYNIPHTSQDKTIHFEAKSIISLENYLLSHKKLTTEAVLKLIYDIGFIIKTLEKTGNSIFAFSLTDIVMLNGEIFMFVNPSKIVQIKNNEMVLKTPISLTDAFISPEIKLDRLPIKCDLGFTYYSFGLLILYLITNKRYEKFSDEVLTDLRDLSGTKLYYFILRCLQEKHFLYI